MSILPLVLWIPLAASPARADSARLQWRLWSWTGAEAMPSVAAEPELRAEQQLLLDLAAPGGWRFDAVGAVRDPAEAGGAVQGDLLRGALHYRGTVVSVDAGRTVLLGSRGLLRLDGLTAQVGRSDTVSLQVWGGRLWHPETWSPGDTWLGGLEVLGRTSPRATVAAGYEARVSGEDLAHRVHAMGALRDLRGGRVSVLTEAEPLSEASELGLPPARLELSAASPAGERLDLSASARWEDLEPATQPEALASPMDWLAGPGYGALDLGLGLQLGALRLSGSASPTWRTIDDGAAGTGGLGAAGRAGVGWRASHALHLGVAAIGAQAEPSWVMGGLAEVGLELGGPADHPIELGAEAGWFRFRPQTGPMADVVEGRLEAEVPLPTPAGAALQGLALVGEVAGGADRLLDPWVRGGLVLRGALGNRTGGLP